MACDHVPPPRIDDVDLGFRVPMLMISPYARRGYVDFPESFAGWSDGKRPEDPHIRYP